MKKISGFLSVLLCFLFLFCGCSKTNDNSGNNSNDNSVAETAIDIDTSNYSEYLSVTSENLSRKSSIYKTQYCIIYTNGKVAYTWSDTYPSGSDIKYVTEHSFIYKLEYLFSIKIKNTSNARCENVKLLIGSYAYGYKEININEYDEITELLTMTKNSSSDRTECDPPKVLFVSGKVYLPSAE